MKRSLHALLMATAVIFPFLANAGGVGLGATRLIYQAGDKQASLNIRNTNPSAPYLIQSWLDDADNVKTTDFAVVPPLSVLRPKSENTLRIMFTGKALPQDRETLYWMTVKAIPQAVSEQKNTLQMAAASRIKVFYRPAGLAEASTKVWQRLEGRFNAGKVTLINPTPYYITLSSLRIDGKKVNPVMIAPKHSVTLTQYFSSAKAAEYQTINDYGALTPVKKINIK